VHGHPERLRTLIDLPELATITDQLRIPRGYLRAVTVRDGQQEFEQCSENERARELYDAGYTLAFGGLRSPGLSLWAKAIERDCGLPPSVLQMHAFACLQAERLPAHCDPACVFVVQVRGKKRWRFARNDHVLSPTTSVSLGDRRNAGELRGLLQVQAPNGLPAAMPDNHEVVDLEPGSTLFIPRGYWHDVEVIGSESFHLSITTRRPTWADLLLLALRLTKTLETLPWREDAPSFFEHGVFRPEVIGELSSRLPELLRTIEADAKHLKDAEIARACASIGFY
jgi:hypothetical protein